MQVKVIFYFCIHDTLILFIFFPFIFIGWRLITLQYCSGFYHTLTRCTGMTQRDGMGRKEGGGFRMENTCKSMADSCQFTIFLYQRENIFIFYKIKHSSLVYDFF